MALISSLILDSIRASRDAARLAAARTQIAPHVRGLLGEAPTVNALPADMMGPPELVSEGSGLLADPYNLENQLRFGAGLLEMPGTAQYGSSFLNQALSQAYQDRRAQQDRILTNEMHEERLRQGADEFDRTMERDEYWQRVRANREAQGRDQQLLFGNLESGMAPGFAPDGSPMVYGVQGSKPWREARARLTSAAAGVEQLDELINIVEEMGSEDLGADAARADWLRGEILSKILQRRGYGTPQEGELARLEEELRGHGGPKAWFSRKGTILASLSRARETFRRGLLGDREEFRFWPGLEEFMGSNFAESTYLPPELAGTVEVEPAQLPRRDVSSGPPRAPGPPPPAFGEATTYPLGERHPLADMFR